MDFNLGWFKVWSAFSFRAFSRKRKQNAKANAHDYSDVADPNHSAGLRTLSERSGRSEENFYQPAPDAGYSTIEEVNGKGSVKLAATNGTAVYEPVDGDIKNAGKTAGASGANGAVPSAPPPPPTKEDGKTETDAPDANTEEMYAKVDKVRSGKRSGERGRPEDADDTIMAENNELYDTHDRRRQGGSKNADDDVIMEENDDELYNS